VAAVDGTMMDAAVDNLLAETSIRYGGYGGIANHLVADTYVALFSRFVPCGVWEAVYLIDSLFQNQSAAQPGQVHANTRGQSLPVFGLAHLLGIDLLPRIRNFQDLTFHRPDPAVCYRHIDQLFSATPAPSSPGTFCAATGQDLMQVALSVKQGAVSSVTLLRRRNNRSRKNQINQAFRESDAPCARWCSWATCPAPYYASRTSGRRTRQWHTTDPPSGSTSATLVG
jgi:TnpA family transposase